MNAPNDHGDLPPTIRVHIERLVVTGVPVHDRASLGTAVQAEMTRLFTEHGWPNAPASGGIAERLDGGVIRPASGGRDGQLGAQIATAVHGGLTR